MTERPSAGAGRQGDSAADSTSSAALFARWVEDPSADDPAGFQRLLSEHPECADELRAMREDWEVLRTLRSSHSVAERLGARPRSEPEREPSADTRAAHELSPDLLARLSERAPASGRYRLKGEVARGGQGAIVHVWDEDLRRNLAMKVLLGRAAELHTGKTPPVDGRSLGRFLEEAQVTSQLDHPGIVPVHELGLDPEGRVYFTMKLVRGEDLRTVLERVREQRGGWTRTRVLGVLLKVCEAMAYAHAKGVIHRDLKPANVMVGAFGEVYVMDWGLARIDGHADDRDLRIRPEPESALHSERSRESDGADSPLLTLDGEVIGTPTYMPPEQALGRQDEVGPHSDVYGLGAMLYHLLAGHAPYVKPGTTPSNYAILLRVREGPPEPVEERASDVSAELVAICEKAMARDPRARYREMGALAEDLRAFLEGRVVAAHRTGPLVELRKWVQRNQPLAASLGAGVLTLAAGLAASLVLKAQSDRNAAMATAREQEARDNFGLAEERRLQVERNRELAESRRDEVLRLSALQDVEDLRAEADGLWPARPESIERYERWIVRARDLLRELPLHWKKREEIRSHALPWTDAEREAQRATHPARAELEALTGEIACRSRALAMRRDHVAAELPLVAWERYPGEASALNAAAWALVDPRRVRFGEEPLGLVLARRALEDARDADRAAIGDTVAMAYFALGRDDEALDASAAALDAAEEGRAFQYEGALGELEKATAELESESGLAREAAALVALETRRAELERAVDERRDWRFPASEPEARWWNNQLTDLIGELEALEKGLLAEDATTEGHGWSIPKRLALARELERGFAAGGAYARAWSEALPAIRAAYAGLELEPELPLVPLGPDPDSGLWEFADLATGAAPERDGRGRLSIGEATSLVFVLLPGGTFAMGAQARDPSGPNYDPSAQTCEGPVHEVALSPFFLSKYEMTQSQWLRVAGRNPSAFGRDATYGPSWNASGRAPDLQHPVEQVSWTEGAEVCARLGLELPSEAQWEYAARGGTTTPWSTGSEPGSLSAAANVADGWSRAHGGPPGLVYEAWDDGNTAHAAVGSYAPNPFGLYDVHGNVWEWCRDGWDENYYGHCPARDPVMEAAGTLARAFRGGSCSHPAAGARSAYRGMTTPEAADGSIGLRPARELRARGAR